MMLAVIAVVLFLFCRKGGAADGMQWISNWYEFKYDRIIYLFHVHESSRITRKNVSTIHNIYLNIYVYT